MVSQLQLLYFARHFLAWSKNTPTPKKNALVQLLQGVTALALIALINILALYLTQWCYTVAGRDMYKASTSNESYNGPSILDRK